MTRRLLDYDPLTMTSTWFEAQSDGAFLIHSEQDDRAINAITDLNKARQNDAEYTKRGMKEDWWHYATVPNVVIEKWLREHKVNFFDKNDKKKVFALLNSPEYRYLKTTAKHHQ